ncbi:MAG: hypothetical protein ACXQT6_05410 [Candidatus Methanospirareceae archaeon]
MRGRFDASEFIKKVNKAERLKRDFDRNVGEASVDTIKFLRDRIPRKTGKTAESVKLKGKGRNKYMIVSDRAHIIRYLDTGTRRHYIFPVKKKALHWIDPVTGEHRFSAGHVVEGIRARGYLTATKLYLMARLRRIQKIFLKEMRRLFK